MLRTLVIDNEPQVREGMKALLDGWGCAVVTAGSILEAKESICGGSALPDVVIADYHLDDGNGLDAIAMTRTIANREIPAVLVTADRSVELRNAAGAMNVPILPKPLRPAALRALLTQWRVTQDAAE